MENLFLDNLYLIMLLPLWLFLIIMVGRFFSVYVNKNIIQILTLLSSLLGSILCAGALYKITPDKILEIQNPFIKINDFIISYGIHVDKLSLIFALVLFLVSFLVQLFSTSYMKDERKTYRFYALLNLFNFSMCGLLFSPNLFQTYFFWEIVGVISYLLIGFEYFKPEKSLASRKVFIINRIGDTALISAIITCAYFMYTYAPNKTFTTLSFIDINTISTLIYAYTSTPLFWVICALFIIGAITKSAQFPFYTWLQDAMEAKLPVSALLHSATMVAVGIFLTLRLMPFFTLENDLLKIIAIIGLITALICSLSACAQTNPKKALAYSTSAQLGLVFFAIGTMNIKIAVAFFIAHAFIKSVLFLSLPRENENWSYIKFISFLLAGLSLSGLIFSGMLVKEALTMNLGLELTIILSVLSFLTAFYIIRIALVVADNNELEKGDVKIQEILAIAGLFVLNILFYIYLRTQIKYQVSEPFWAALTAWICVYILYRKRAFWKVPIIYQLTKNGFYLDKFYMSFCTALYEAFANICNFVDNKILGNYKLLRLGAKFGVNIFDFVETKIMNGTISAIAKFNKKLSSIELKAQNSDIRRYNAYAFVIITIILICLLLGYTATIIFIRGING